MVILPELLIERSLGVLKKAEYFDPTLPPLRARRNMTEIQSTLVTLAGIVGAHNAMRH